MPDPYLASYSSRYSLTYCAIHNPPVGLPCISPELHIPFAADGKASTRSARQGGRKCRGRCDKESRDSELHGGGGGRGQDE